MVSLKVGRLTFIRKYLFSAIPIFEIQAVLNGTVFVCEAELFGC